MSAWDSDISKDGSTIGLRNVGSPIELYRVAEPVYADQALTSWVSYVRRTVGASMAAGGRFNPVCEFGALYTSDDEATAWEEVAARMQRQGMSGISPEMRLLRLVVLAGEYVDLCESGMAEEWGVTMDRIADPAPSPETEAACWNVARAIRAVADFLEAPSARGTGRNIPIFPDREADTLRLDLASVEVNRVPSHLSQTATESW